MSKKFPKTSKLLEHLLELLSRTEVGDNLVLSFFENEFFCDYENSYFIVVKDMDLPVDFTVVNVRLDVIIINEYVYRRAYYCDYEASMILVQVMFEFAYHKERLGSSA